jgi:hypothetical protein
VLYQNRRIRQRLLAQSDVERSQTYEFCGAASLPVTGFQATLRITPIVDGDRAFVEWWATFDCDAPGRDELTGTLRSSFGKWLESLRSTLAGLPAGSPDATAGISGRSDAVSGRFTRNTSDIGLSGRIDRLARTVAFTVRIWHSSARCWRAIAGGLSDAGVAQW